MILVPFNLMGEEILNLGDAALVVSDSVKGEKVAGRFEPGKTYVVEFGHLVRSVPGEDSPLNRTGPSSRTRKVVFIGVNVWERDAKVKSFL